MKSFAAAVFAMMAGSAMAFAPSTSGQSSTATKAMPDRMWDEMVDKTERSASLPWLPRAKALDGSMVGDVHRTLLYGGVFGYPGDTKNPNGKLRLLYEGAPMSFIMEQAGGISTTGTERVMEIQPEFVHQRVPIVMGSKNAVQEVVDAYAAEQ